ncbi:hypothetical protein A2Z63_01510 [Candidatus Giovannonibacteria bacterium RIFCSPLOWO2_02_44_8]|nr:MAG: hypothetical protein A2Z63_01510 [Candidatus Giovannonibacteria bacterium RIFCSPLOWO2_02_44_8]
MDYLIYHLPVTIIVVFIVASIIFFYFLKKHPDITIRFFVIPITIIIIAFLIYVFFSGAYLITLY